MHGREFVGEACAQRLPCVEECAAPGRDLGEHAAGHDVARRELGERMTRQHETLAIGVDQRRPFAAQRLRRQRCRIAADHDGGGVKLHEFRIGDHGAGARGDRKARSACFKRIGGDGIEMAEAAGREHHRA